MRPCPSSGEDPSVPMSLAPPPPFPPCAAISPPPCTTASFQAFLATEAQAFLALTATSCDIVLASPPPELSSPSPDRSSPSSGPPSPSSVIASPLPAQSPAVRFDESPFRLEDLDYALESLDASLVLDAPTATADPEAWDALWSVEDASDAEIFRLLDAGSSATAVAAEEGDEEEEITGDDDDAGVDTRVDAGDDLAVDGEVVFLEVRPPADVGSPNEVELVEVRPAVNPPSSPSSLLVDSDEVVHRRLRRSNTRTRKLPSAPTHHPRDGRENTYDPAAYEDPSVTWSVKMLHDSHGEPPRLAYLVEWAVTPLQISWIWEEDLVTGCEELRMQVDQWKALEEAGEDVGPFESYRNRHFKGHQASATGLCFMDAVQAACYELGDPHLITTTHWDGFLEAQRVRPVTTDPRSLPIAKRGVNKAEVSAFFDFLLKKRVPIDYDEVFRKRLKGSAPTIHEFHKMAKTMASGVYIVGAEDRGGLQHCFVMIVDQAKADVSVIDNFNDEEPDQAIQEPLTNLGWLGKVIFTRRIVKAALGLKRKSKAQRNRMKKLRGE